MNFAEAAGPVVNSHARQGVDQTNKDQSAPKVRHKRNGSLLGT